MPNQVLIVATEVAARTPAEIARSLQLTPVIATEPDALDLLGRQQFSLIAVSGNAAWQRLRDAAENRQPMTRVIELPEAPGDDDAIRRLLVRYLAPRAAERPNFSEERYRFLSGILESFTATLDLREVLRRIVTVTQQEFGADRAWLIHPINEDVEFARVAFSVTNPACGASDSIDNAPVPLGGSKDRKSVV